MTLHVFVGPTIDAGTVSSALPEARIHPPVRHGDLLSLSARPGDRVAIVDGIFFRTGAIRHKEILHLLQQGVEVSGASSMGALRAAELDAFGMRGVGIVYRLYSSGLVTGDDEVAVLHGEGETGYRAMTEALVAVRVATSRARRHGVITGDDERAVVAAGKELPFGDRTYRSILSSARDRGLSAGAAESFTAYLRSGQQDVKREDALRLLRLLRTPAAGAAAASVAGVPMTSFLLRWIRSAPTRLVDGEPVSAMATLTACQVFADDYPALQRRVVLRELVRAELGEATLSGVNDAEEVASLACEAARRRGLLPDPDADTGDLPAGFTAWLAPGERDLPRKEAALRVLTRSFRWAPNVRILEPLVDRLSDTEAWALAERQVARSQQFNAKLAAVRTSFTPHHLSEVKLRGWVMGRWRADHLPTALWDRGFGSEADLRTRAAMFLPVDVLEGVPPFSLAPRRPPQ